MRKLLSILLCLIMCILFVGCNSTKEIFVFDNLGIEVKMQIDETINVLHDDKAMLISNIKNNDALGVISVFKEKGKNINEIYDTYITGSDEITKTELSDDLIFIDFINKVDSVMLGERVDKMYFFIFYDENTETVLYGRFFENCERDHVISLAKSIEVS